MTQFKSLLEHLLNNQPLTRIQAEEAAGHLIDPSCPAEQKSAFLIALRMKGEIADEIAGLAQYLLKAAIPVLPQRKDLIDTCGTGGDGSGTFNISTTVALVVAAAGLGVAKHGNRSVSSQCGSADVLEALGVNVGLTAEDAARSIDANGFAFLFAPNFHPAFKYIAPVRKTLGVRTVFNLLGPLLNPARVKRQIVGVFDRKMIVTMAESLRQLGSEEVLVVSSEDGMDEISLSAPTWAVHLKADRVTEVTFCPEDVGMARQPLRSLAGGDAKKNAAIIESVLNGQLGPHRDIVQLNAGAALWIGGKAAALKDGVEQAGRVLDSGAASTLLERLRTWK